MRKLEQNYKITLKKFKYIGNKPVSFEVFADNKKDD